MKKIISSIIIFVMIAAAGCLVSCGSGGDGSAPSGMKIASPADAPFELFVPSAWQCDVSSGESTAYYSGTDSSSVSVMSFQIPDPEADPFEWWNGYKAEYERVYKDFKVVGDGEKASLDGVEGAKFVFTGSLELDGKKVGYKFMQISVIRPSEDGTGEAFVFTYASFPEVYDDHLEDVGSVIENFRFKKNRPAPKTEPVDKMTVISNEAVPYEFSIPAGWQSDVASGSVIARYSQDGSSVSVTSFSIENSAEPLADWWKTFESDFGIVYTGVEVVNSEDVALGGEAAVKHVFTGSLGEDGEKTEYKFMQIATVKKKFLSRPEVYVFTYSSTPEAFDSHLPDIDAMISAFKFK